MKKVIFIGGSSHSGSTLLDLMLSNHPECFSAGEVQSLFRPSKPHHLNPICGCGVKDCQVWEDIHAKGEKNLYENIFFKYPEIDTIVDSSKSMSWFYDQNRFLSGKNIKIYHFVIWKKPLEIAISLYKRNKIEKFNKSWTGYYKNYFNFIKCPVAVKYRELAQNPATTIQSLMTIIGKEAIPDQHLYWQKKHHTLFGSTSSRIHMHTPGSEEYMRLLSYIQKNNEKINLSSNQFYKNYRIIKYTPMTSNLLPTDMAKKINSNKSAKAIVAELEKHDHSISALSDSVCRTNKLLPHFSIVTKRLKRILSNR